MHRLSPSELSRTQQQTPATSPSSKPFSMPRNAPPESPKLAACTTPAASKKPLADCTHEQRIQRKHTHCPSRARAQDASPQKHTRRVPNTQTLSRSVRGSPKPPPPPLSDASRGGPSNSERPRHSLITRPQQKSLPTLITSPQTTTPFNRTCRGPSSKSGVSRINTIHSLREYPRLSYRLQPLSSRAAR